MLTHIHHLTFLARELDATVREYENSFGVGPFIREKLPNRGVETARVKIGETWLVFAEPTDPNSEPGRHLAGSGEGLFLMSLGVEDLDRSIAALRDTPMHANVTTRRKGLANWEVVDLATETGAGYSLQLTHE